MYAVRGAYPRPNPVRFDADIDDPKIVRGIGVCSSPKSWAIWDAYVAERRAREEVVASDASRRQRQRDREANQRRKRKRAERQKREDAERRRKEKRTARK